MIKDELFRNLNFFLMKIYVLFTIHMYFIVYQARVGILTPSLEKNYNMCDIQELMIDDGTEEKFKRETCLTFLSCHVTI